MEPVDPSRAMLVALEWIPRHCCIPDGFNRGLPFELSTEQFVFVANHYTVRESPKDGALGSAFQHRRSQLVRPQKWGKSPLAAAVICLEAVGPALFDGFADEGDVYRCADHGCGCDWVYRYKPGEPMGVPWPTPLIQVTATSEEQTDNVYAALRPMIELGRLADLIPKTGEEFIRLPGGGRIDVVTSNAKSRLGQRVTFVVQDETGIWLGSMVKVAETQRRGLAGMDGRAIEFTNAWDPAEFSVAQRTAESTVDDLNRDHLLSPAGWSYRNKADRRKVHRLVYGDSLRERGGWVELDAIEAEAAELLERDPAQAERFFGNRIVSGHGAWLPEGLWESTEASTVPPDGASVALGFDGSETDDWTAIRLETLDGEFRFTPTYGPDALPTVWRPDEWGGQIPRAEVGAAVDELCKRFRVVRAYCDPRGWQSEIADWGARHGEKVFAEWATYRPVQMHAALERSVSDLASGRSTHDGCELTALAVRNARKLARPGERYILGKASQGQKIDVAMADVLAHEAAADARAAGLTGRRFRSFTA